MRPKLSRSQLIQASQRCYENAQDLEGEARILLAAHRFPRAYVLASFAFEELGKAHMYDRALTFAEDDPRWLDFHRTMRNDHKPKMRELWEAIYANAREIGYGFHWPHERIDVMVREQYQRRKDALYVDALNGDMRTPVEKFQEELVSEFVNFVSLAVRTNPPGRHAFEEMRLRSER